MHCEKGNTHFIYLEQTRHENYQAERGGRNITKDERTREKVWILFVFIRYEPVVSILVKVDFGDTLDSSSDTLEFVSLPFGINKGVSEKWDGQSRGRSLSVLHVWTPANFIW